MNINSRPRFYTLWAINGPLEQSRLRRQMDQFKRAGLDGVVFHPRFYPNDPVYLGESYLKEVSDAILYAKAIGLAFWLYDEDGWPSGTVSGQLLKKYPADAQRYANLVGARPERCLAEFEYSGETWFLEERTGLGVDYFSPDLSRHFIELTYERYRTGLDPGAWDHVEAIFSDEPEFGLGHAYDSLSRHGSIPWTPKLPELFRQRYGEDLLPQISGLFFAAEETAPLRVKFWELLTEIFNGSFTTPINDWCRQHRKLFTAHVKGEEHPLFQVPTNGSCHQFFRSLDLPGIDALERYPANNFYPRQVSAAARQFGNGRCMVEAFGGAGWGATPADLERYLLWLGRNGLTDFVLHLSQYRLDSAAMHDWPPSQPLHLTWREAYPELLRRVRQELEHHPRPEADTLIVAPYRGIMASYEPQEFLKTNVHNAATYPDSVAGKINRRFVGYIESLNAFKVNYDVADERTVEQFGMLSNGKLVVGNCQYRRVIVDDDCRLNTTTASLLGPLTLKAESALTVDKNLVYKTSTSKCESSTTWKLQAQVINNLLLESVPETGGWFTAQFNISTGLPDAALELVFADEIALLSVNGQSLSLGSSNEGSRANIAGAERIGSNTIRFRPINRVKHPFLWLQGIFHVMSDSAFTDGPSGTVKTEGPFKVCPASKTTERNLIEAGFPFLHSPLFAASEIELLCESKSLALIGAEAAAIRLIIDGRDIGWSWQVGGEAHFDVALSAGAHRLQIELVPNTFNAFGPHHYYGGDWHVVSPDQIRGIRNFADPLDAPANTHVKTWHFRRFELPEKLELIVL